MLRRFEMLVPYFGVGLEWYMAYGAFESACSGVGCLRVIDPALSAFIAEEGAGICHGDVAEKLAPQSRGASYGAFTDVDVNMRRPAKVIVSPTEIEVYSDWSGGS